MAEETAEKPVVESFQLDHTKVKEPYVRYIDTETGPHGDVISNYDLRLTQPNKQAIPTGGLHNEIRPVRITALFRDGLLAEAPDLPLFPAAKP